MSSSSPCICWQCYEHGERNPCIHVLEVHENGKRAGKADAESRIAALEREKEELRAELGKMREAVIRNYNSDQKDYACAQCDPHSEVLISGFQCAYHIALAAKENK